MGTKLPGFPQLLQPLPDYSEDYKERTTGTPVQLHVPRSSKDPQSCKATRDNQQSVFDAYFPITVCAYFLSKFSPAVEKT